MIDYFCIFANAAAAQADPTVGAFWNATSSIWDTSQVFPGISVITSAPTINGINSSTGFWIIISRLNRDAGLDATAVMALDREIGRGDGNFVLFAAGSLNGTARTNLNFGPVPHGSGYPRPLGK
jgi:microcompartment protein CcmK/EutM